MKFTKMEGIGNDYIYIDNRDHHFDYNPEFITKISDRHFGIGADGLIALEDSDTYDFKMRMFNADGSEGKMCGNGIRCLAKFAYDNGIVEKTHLEIETLSGLRVVDLLMEDGEVVGGTVDMGVPSYKTADLPMNYENDTMVNGEFVVNGTTYKGTAISVGNPHVVMFYKHMPSEIHEVGFKIEHSGLFPEKVNVEFVELLDHDHIKMRVWERGSGETMACGTGACASAFAAMLEGKVGNKVDVELLGGHLVIEYKNEHLFLTGKARTSFTGEVKEEDYAK